MSARPRRSAAAGAAAAARTARPGECKCFVVLQLYAAGDRAAGADRQRFYLAAAELRRAVMDPATPVAERERLRSAGRLMLGVLV